MIVLGVDPGSREFGWALLDVRGGAGLPLRATFLATGNAASDYLTALQLLAGGALPARPEVVAIEKISGWAFAPKGAGVVAALIASSSVAGGIAWVARSRGLRVEERTANEVRRLLLGKAGSGDAQVKEAIPGLIYGWPKRSNNHQRDAAMVALASVQAKGAVAA